uniref:Uncharacterized protein n=1 Tax=Rhipicephalus appendiculatus TaxID=34631 RepID=A0A131YDC0_RHIAP
MLGGRRGFYASAITTPSAFRPSATDLDADLVVVIANDGHVSRRRAPHTVPTVVVAFAEVAQVFLVPTATTATTVTSAIKVSTAARPTTATVAVREPLFELLVDSPSRRTVVVFFNSLLHDALFTDKPIPDVIIVVVAT